jgi:hypothetical protein
MPSNYIQSVADKHKISISKLEDYWEQAKAIAAKDGKKSSDSFFALTTSIFKGLVEKEEKVSLEETMSADVAQPDRELFGRPVFRVSSDLFYKVGFSNRNAHGWRSKFYEEPLGRWCASNKGKAFSIENEETGWIMDIDRDRYNKTGKEKEVDEKLFKRKSC